MIQYKKGEENHHLSNPYNTRNALGHEKQHIKQGVSHYHQEKGWVIDYRSARELDAIKVQRTLPSWSKTTLNLKQLSNYMKIDGNDFKQISFIASIIHF
ncbi:MAG: hypothetical protein IPJ54_17525 [Saprospiraceae bacterium]|nr:hypothetical protein [Saprospiraceae bacterium]